MARIVRIALARSAEFRQLFKPVQSRNFMACDTFRAKDSFVKARNSQFCSMHWDDQEHDATKVSGM
jgi:hypothetical protein